MSIFRGQGFVFAFLSLLVLGSVSIANAQDVIFSELFRDSGFGSVDLQMVDKLSPPVSPQDMESCCKDNGGSYSKTCTNKVVGICVSHWESCSFNGDFPCAYHTCMGNSAKPGENCTVKDGIGKGLAPDIY